MSNNIIIPSGFRIISPVPMDDRSIIKTYSELVDPSFIMRCPIGFIVTVTDDDSEFKNGTYRRIADEPFWKKISDDNSGSFADYRYYDYIPYAPAKIKSTDVDNTVGDSECVYIDCEYTTTYNEKDTIRISKINNSDDIIVPYDNCLDNENYVLRNVIIDVSQNINKIVIPNTIYEVTINTSSIEGISINEIYIPNSVTKLTLNFPFTGKLIIPNPSDKLIASTFIIQYKGIIDKFTVYTSHTAKFITINSKFKYVFSDVDYYYDFINTYKEVLETADKHIVKIDGATYMLPLLVESYDPILNTITISEDGLGRYLLLKGNGDSFILKDLETASITGEIDLGDLSGYGRTTVQQYYADPTSSSASTYGYDSTTDLNQYSTQWVQDI